MSFRDLILRQRQERLNREEREKFRKQREHDAFIAREEAKRQACINRLMSFVRSTEIRQIFEDLNHEMLNGAGHIVEDGPRYRPAGYDSGQLPERPSTSWPDSVSYKMHIEWPKPDISSPSYNTLLIIFSAIHTERGAYESGYTSCFVAGHGTHYANEWNLSRKLRKEVATVYEDLCEQHNIPI